MPLAIVALGCILGIAVYLSLSLDDAGTAEGVRPADGAPAAVSGTLGTTRPNVGDFSIKHAFTQLYGNYDPNLDGAFWKATAAPSALQEWNGRDLFIRPLISKEFVGAGNARHVLVTNSLAVKNSDVVKQGTGCRTCGSLIGAAVFERQSHGWKLISRHDFLTADGRWGAPPKVTLSFPGSGGIELQFEPRSGEPGEPIKQRHTIVLKERKERAPAVARSSARDEAKK